MTLAKLPDSGCEPLQARLSDFMDASGVLVYIAHLEGLEAAFTACGYYTEYALFASAADEVARLAGELLEALETGEVTG